MKDGIMTLNIPSVKLANGVEMPAIGLGTWPMDDVEASSAVSTAIGMGYRMVDTAENYRNEVGVGEGIRRSGVPRSEIFVTTKFNREWHSIQGVRAACEASLSRLKVDYVDLLLIHWPNPDQGGYVAAFEGLTRVLDAGLARSIGVSNFKPAHLQKLSDAGFEPHLNQIQLDPYHRRQDVVAIHQAKGIVTAAWSPLGRGNGLLTDPVIGAIAVSHDRTPAQVVLRWHAALGYVSVPKSSDPERQLQNLSIFDFDLSPSELDLLNSFEESNEEILDSDVVGH